MGLKIFQEGNVFSTNGADEDFGCCKCSSIIQKNESGFGCKVMGKERIFCEACQNHENKDDYNNEKEKDCACKIGLLKNREHYHIKFTRK
jgi:hypothetical protein